MNLAENEVLVYHDPDDSRVDDIKAFLEPFHMDIIQLDWYANKFDVYGWNQILIMLGHDDLIDILNREHPDFILLVQDKDLAPDKLAHTVIRHPGMIKGPLVCKGKTALICEDPAAVLDLF